MTELLAGPFLKRVCIMGTPIPGDRAGTTEVPTLCDTEPTLLLVVIVGGAIAALIVGLVLAFVARRRALMMPPATAPLAAAAPQATARPAVTREQSVQPVELDHSDEWRRDVYVRLMAFVDKAMAEVGRTMPDENSLPGGPPVAPESEESGKLAAELRALASSRARSAYAAWAQTLFHFSLLARDVAEAEAQNLPKEEYRDDVLELQRTRSTVFELADGLRRQAADELGVRGSSTRAARRA